MVRTAEPSGTEMEAPDGVADKMSAATGLQPDLIDDDDFGMECHLNVDGGQKFSTGVIPLVRDIMGWPVVGADSVPAPLKM